MIKKLLLVFTLLAFVTGCGYLPASKQARKVVGKKVYVDVVVPLQDPENAVIIKDATRQAVVTRFHSSLVPKEMAKTVLLVEMAGTSFIPLQYDENGYIIVYRTVVNIRVTRSSSGESQSYSSKGNFDFTIEPNAVITDSQRFNAITNASLKALDSFVAQVGAQGSEL